MVFDEGYGWVNDLQGILGASEPGMLVFFLFVLAFLGERIHTRRRPNAQLQVGHARQRLSFVMGMAATCSAQDCGARPVAIH